MCCTYCHKQGNLVEGCWTLKPTLLPLKLKEKVEKENGRDGNKDSVIGVFQDDSNIDVDVQTKEGPFK